MRSSLATAARFRVLYERRMERARRLEVARQVARDRLDQEKARELLDELERQGKIRHVGDRWYPVSRAGVVR